MADDKYLVIARKWRPQKFDDVVGQQHITRTLQNAIRSGRIGHAFLFIGSRGIGKTTTARILAKALNCDAFPGPTTEPCGECANCRSIAAGTNIDVIEIDGASNNGVEDIRNLRENIRLVPSRSRYKIYVIDEVHQLSQGAFNALLKTLEEPPEHAIFILATTEAHKIPATIVSRCQRYDFRRAGVDSVVTLLGAILEHEGVRCSREALYAIARAGDGSVRDAESILEQLVSYCGNEITFEDVFDVLGLVDWQVMHSLCEALIARDIGTQLRIVDDLVSVGKDLSQFVIELLQFFRNLLVCKVADPAGLLALPEAEINALRAHADQFTLTNLIRMIEQFAELTKGFDSQLAQRIALETMLIRVSKAVVEKSLDFVLEKLVELGGGGIGPASAVAGKARSVGAAAAVRHAVPAADATNGELPPAQDAPGRAGEDRFTVSGDTLDSFWPWFTEQTAERVLNAAIALGQCLSQSVEDGVLVLRFGQDQSRSRTTIERPENLAELERLLAEHTTNLRAIRCETVAESLGGGGRAKPDVPRAARVSAEEARTALKEPAVARVVEIFRGEIVSVRRHVKDSEHD